MMLSSKTLLLLNVNKIYFKRTLFTITDRWVTFTTNQSANNRNVCSNQLTTIGLRQLSAGPKKSKDPVKVSFVDDEPRLTHMERLKRVVQNYGTTAVVLHIVISLASLGIWYSLIYFGVDVPSYIDLERFGDKASKVVGASGTLAVAYALHKLCMPFRVTATVLLTPVVVQRLRLLGIIKKPHKPL